MSQDSSHAHATESRVPVDNGGGLGHFLRTRRARLQPAQVGLDHTGGVHSIDRRRVPGLRREELAQLAGVSIGYYTRLEQGQGHQASEAVLNSLARALMLDEQETRQLHRLARPSPIAVPQRRREVVRPSVQRLIDQVAVPAVVIGRTRDVLSWNRLGHLLVAGHLPYEAPTAQTGRPNLVRLVFLDPATRSLYVDWREKALDTVADLRRAAAQLPDDAKLAALVAELRRESPEFEQLWATHPVQVCASQVRRLSHPVAGRIVVAIEVMELPDDEGQKLVTFTVEAGSPSEDGLALLLTESPDLDVRARP